jgi:hypothetical protein
MSQQPTYKRYIFNITSSIGEREGNIIYESTSSSSNIKVLRVFLLLYLTHQLVSKTLIRPTQGHLRWIGNKNYSDQVLMLDGWEVRSYTIIPSLLRYVLWTNIHVLKQQCLKVTPSFWRIRLFIFELSTYEGHVTHEPRLWPCICEGPWFSSTCRTIDMVCWNLHWAYFLEMGMIQIPAYHETLFIVCPYRNPYRNPW